MDDVLTYHLVKDDEHKNNIIESVLSGKQALDDAGRPLKYVVDVAKHTARFTTETMGILRTIRDLGEPTYEDVMAALGYATDIAMINDFMDRGIIDLFICGGTAERRTLKVGYKRIVYQIDI